MKNKLKVVLILLLFCGGLLTAQTKEEAMRDAKITSKATLEMDFKTVTKYTLPSVVKLMGGEENAITFMENTFDSMKSQGFKFEKAEILDVSEVVEEQGQFRCYIEGFNQMVMANQRISSKSYLLGIYNEDGKYWWFIEAKQLKNKPMMQKVLPDFETALEIPEDDVKMEPLED